MQKSKQASKQAIKQANGTKIKKPSKEGAQIREISTELKLSNLSARQGFKQKRSNQKLNNPSAKPQIRQQNSIPAPNYKSLCPCLSMSMNLSKIAAQELLNPISMSLPFQELSTKFQQQKLFNHSCRMPIPTHSP
jgi:hypothetical protein